MPRRPEPNRWRDGVAFRGKSWYYRVSRVDPATGKRHFLTRGGYRTKDEVLAARAEELLRLRRGGLANEARAPLADYLDRWLAASPARVRPTTLAGYAGHVRNHLAPRLGRLPLASVTAATVRQLHADLLAAGLAPATVQRVHATLRAALQQAVRDGLLCQCRSKVDPLVTIES